jgi:hypothetical protein
MWAGFGRLKTLISLFYRILKTAAGGTLNLYSEFRIKKMVSVYAGVGICKSLF